MVDGTETKEDIGFDYRETNYIFPIFEYIDEEVIESLNVKNPNYDIMQEPEGIYIKPKADK